MEHSEKKVWAKRFLQIFVVFWIRICAGIYPSLLLPQVDVGTNEGNDDDDDDNDHDTNSREKHLLGKRWNTEKNSRLIDDRIESVDTEWHNSRHQPCQNHDNLCPGHGKQRIFSYEY